MTRRVVQVIRLRPGKADDYRALHRAVPQPVLDRLRACHISNYSIHLCGDLLIGCFDYRGDDFDADMLRMAEDEATQAWWRLTAPCQESVADAAPGQWWAPTEQLFLME
ncbi:L-rhamnose mutarotase [Kitasatospora sp. NPDC058406]|uniref:L-rhamnose mutarotase n=1 Tax=Kitasatospora sp. NPDC058406 TaxID=3346483 RepID=UPI00366680D3